MQKNLYHSTARPQVNAAPFAGAQSCDVVIVGGGYTGLSTALHLAQGGADVIVLEAKEIGHGCSGRNGGQVNPGLKLTPNEITAKWGGDLGPRYNQLAADAARYVFDLVERYDIDCSATKGGTIRAATSQETLADLRSLTAECREMGGEMRMLSAAEIAAMTGTDAYVGGAIDPAGGHVNPLGYARGLALAALAHGAKIHPNSPVTALKREAGGWTVTVANGGKVSAKHIVMATNGYTGDLWPRMRQSLVPIYTYVVATDPLPAELRRQIMPCEAALFELGWNTVYYRIDDEGRLVIGGRGPQRDARAAQDYDIVISHARRLWPALAKVAFPYGWHGQIAMTKDHLAHLIEPEPGAHLMFGYNGRGIAMATTAGRLVAERILSNGTAQIDMPVRQKLDPYFFHPFWKIGAAAAIGWNRVSDFAKRR